MVVSFLRLQFLYDLLEMRQLLRAQRCLLGEEGDKGGDHSAQGLPDEIAHQAQEGVPAGFARRIHIDAARLASNQVTFLTKAIQDG